MGVRARLVFAGRGRRRLEAVCLLNGGFETDEPALLLPQPAAKRVLSTPLSRARKVRFEVAGGEAEFLVATERIRARVVTPDRQGPQIRLTVTVSKGEREILISDTAIDALGVQVVSFGRGLWRYAGERRVRPSEPAQIW